MSQLNFQQVMDYLQQQIDLSDFGQAVQQMAGSLINEKQRNPDFANNMFDTEILDKATNLLFHKFDSPNVTKDELNGLGKIFGDLIVTGVNKPNYNLTELFQDFEDRVAELKAEAAERIVKEFDFEIDNDWILPEDKPLNKWQEFVQKHDDFAQQHNIAYGAAQTIGGIGGALYFKNKSEELQAEIAEMDNVTILKRGEKLAVDAGVVGSCVLAFNGAILATTKHDLGYWAKQALENSKKNSIRIV